MVLLPVNLEREFDGLVEFVEVHVNRLALGIHVMSKLGVHLGAKLDGVPLVGSDFRHAPNRIAA